MKSPKTNVLKYEGGELYEPPFLVPAKTVIPQWYKDDKRLPSETKTFSDKHLKHCVPFLDALVTGYSIVTPYDLTVVIKEDGPHIEWGSRSVEPASTRSKYSALTLPTPTGYNNIHFIWMIKGAIEIPKGYSALFTHPVNQYDLPFLTLSGVIDDILLPDGSIPFFLKEGFKGLIPKGTPVLQIFLFKRENWISKKIKGLNNKSKENNFYFITTFKGWYKQHGWKQKKYN